MKYIEFNFTAIREEAEDLFRLSLCVCGSPGFDRRKTPGSLL